MQFQLLCVAAVLSASATCCVRVAAQAEAPQSGEKADVAAPELSEYYQAAARKCEELFASGDRLVTLPQGIVSVHARPDMLPVFEFSEPTHVSRTRTRKASEANWHATPVQTWNDKFRMVNNASFIGEGTTDNFWLKYGLVFDHFKKGDWTAYRLSDDRGRTNLAQPTSFAPAADGTWWWGTSKGLFVADDGKLTPVELPNWPEGGITGVISNADGLALALSPSTAKGEKSLAFFDKKAWRVARIRTKAQLSNVALRSDGSALLLGQGLASVVAPPAEDADPAHVTELANRFQVGQDWISPGVYAISPDNSVLFHGAMVTPRKIIRGFVRYLNGREAEWIPSEASVARMTAAPDNSFLLLSSDGTLRELGPKQYQLEDITRSVELRPHDLLLGCDNQRRLYLMRNGAVMTLFLDREGEPYEPFSAIYDLARGEPSIFRAAVDRNEVVWFIDRDGKVMTLGADDDKPSLADNRIVKAETLWPGDDGSMLILQSDGKAAFAFDRQTVVLADSLPELAQQVSKDMQRAAPKTTTDRRLLTQPATVHFPISGTPWFAVGKSLFVRTSKELCRVQDGKLEVVCEGNVVMLGPLKNGSLLLQQVEMPGIANSTAANVATWRMLENPEADWRIEPISSLDPMHADSSKDNSANLATNWKLDQRGNLWLHQYPGKVYVTGAGKRWLPRSGLGVPYFEYPTGVVWFRSAFPAEDYELCDEAGRSQKLNFAPGNRLTPLAVIEGEVVCLTPTGLARLAFDEGDWTAKLAEESKPVRFGGEPRGYIGRSNGRLWFVVYSEPPARNKAGNRLIAIEWPLKAQ